MEANRNMWKEDSERSNSNIRVVYYGNQQLSYSITERNAMKDGRVFHGRI